MKFEHFNFTTDNQKSKEQISFLVQKKKKKSSLRIFWGFFPTFNIPSTEFMQTRQLFDLNSFLFISHTTLSTHHSRSKWIKSNLQLMTTSPFLIDDSISIFDEYHWLRHSSFIKFFEQQHVDIPKCFKRVTSMRRSSFELPFLKLINYIMSNGNKQSILIKLIKASHLLFQLHKTTKTYSYNVDIASWLRLFLLHNTTSFITDKWHRLTPNRYLNSYNHHFFKNNLKYYSFANYLIRFTLNYLLVLQPLFKFSIYSVDKKMRKITRKKKAKYIFIWKYVPVYKRHSVLLKLVADNFKFIAGKTFDEKLLSVFQNFFYNLSNTHTYQVFTFTHNYVFKNLKRSLLRNFKTTI